MAQPLASAALNGGRVRVLDGACSHGRDGPGGAVQCSAVQCSAVLLLVLVLCSCLWLGARWKAGVGVGVGCR